MPEKEQAQAFWQDRAWWRKNGLKVIGTLITLAILITGALITFNNHTADIADLEEENDSLKDLVVTLNTSVIQFEVSLTNLIEDVADLDVGIGKIESILMGQEE